MTLYSAFSILLSRYSRQDDVAISTVTAARSHYMNRTIGYFLNTLILRLQLQHEASFIEVLQRAKKNVLDAHRHQALPFAELVKALRPERSYNANPFTQISFTVEPPIPRSTSGWSVSQVEAHNGTAKSDLTVEIDDLPTHLIARFEYSTELFEQSTIERLAGHFQYLLTQILQQPTHAIQHLPIVPPAEQQQLLAWTHTQQPFPDAKAIQSLFENQVATTPQAIALCFEDQQLTYEQLNGLANQLAHYLRKQGVKETTLVAICVERSPSMIICLLAVLKAGGAFLPLDASYPKARLNFMLTDAKVGYLLLESHLTHLFNEADHAIKCIDVAQARLESVRESWQNPDLTTDAHQLAYVIYTSGSTGQPKGVMLAHQGLCNLAVAQIKHFKITAECRILQFAAFCFDAAISEIFTALLSGAALYLAAKPDILPGQPLLDFLRKHRITTVTLPPSALTLFPSTELTDLHTLIVAGEACPLELAKQWAEGRQFYNAYGPTETTVCATILPFAATMARMTIGYPLDNIELYVLDNTKQFAPIGVAGELYIGGVGVACGYLNRPELTRDRFINHPFIPTAAEQVPRKIYKTGDLVRYLPNGQLEFFGRIDEQVKLRGYRIELGEIETVLTQHPTVKSAVVVLYPQHNQLSLAAYVTLHEPVTPDVLRESLKAHLPAYMIPATFTVLEALPLTPNGKINRKALPKPDRQGTSGSTHPITARNQLEIGLMELWQQVLNRTEINIHDNFFDLGGHSLLAIQLIAQINQLLSIQLSIRDLFELPTIAQLAAKINDDIVIHAADFDLNAEVQLDASIEAHQLLAYPLDKRTPPQHILLTGATGFLGVYLLRELLDRTAATIYCLVRAEHKTQAQHRLTNALKTHALWDATLQNRIVPICGDLSLPLLGLSEATFAHLGQQIDVIYHNGSLVNHLYTYSVMKKPNVLGTQEVLRLATTTCLKPVHYVSTLGVLASTQAEATHVYHEQDQLEDGNALQGGYNQSKWVAEQLLYRAQQAGVPVSLYRPYIVGGHSETGISNLHDFRSLLIYAGLKLGYWPDMEMLLNIAPVDYVSQALVHLSQQPAALGQTFHLASPCTLTLNQLFETIVEIGYPVKPLPLAQWQTLLTETAQASQDKVLVSLSPFFSANSQDGAGSQQTPKLDSQKTIDYLSSRGILCPTLNAEIVKRYLDYFVASGFIPVSY